MVEALRRGHPEQRAHLARAARLTEDRHVAGIAAERGDVVAHPLEAGDDVAHARVAGVGELLAAKLREVHEAERVQPMRDADDHDVVLAGQVGAVIRHHSGRAGRIAAAVQPHHHRPLPCADARRPDVQVEAVFAHRLAQVERCPFLDEDRIDERRAQPELEGVADAGPRLRFHRRLKAPRACRGRAVRDASEGLDAVDREAADFAGGGLHGGAGRAGSRRLRERARQRSVEQRSPPRPRMRCR